MERNTKIILGLAGAGVLAYLLLKGSKAQAQTPSGSDQTSEPSDLPHMIKDGAVVNGKKWTIKSQADCPAGYNFGDWLPQPCSYGNKNCDSGGPRCVKIEDQISRSICSAGQMPCPDDSGCFDPILDPISNWEAGLNHPCNRSIKIKYVPEYGLSDYGSGYATGY